MVGRKHTTRLVPRAPPFWNSGFEETGASGASNGQCCSESLVKTKVSVYAGFCSPVTRLLPVQR